MRTSLSKLFFLALLAFICVNASGSSRFPPPDFESYQIPGTTTPEAREIVLEYVDVAVLLFALIAGTYFVYKKRSRKLIFALTIFSLLYFGFYRKGCICSIGAIGNAALSIFDSNYAMPLTAIAFFVLPMLFTLIFGRVFCSGVCPLGVLQDIVLLKPIKVSGWLESAIRILAYAYLGLAILYAATSSAFVICRYDPFVAFFRLGGNANMLVVGACFLIIGAFIGRPYCRFLCPYGIILRNLSRLSFRKVTITPTDCINCSLCENSCPFGAIEKPTANWPEKSYAKNKTLLTVAILLIPVITVAGGMLGKVAAKQMARGHATVRLADRINLEETEVVSEMTDQSEAFRATGKSISQLYLDAAAIESKFDKGALALGIALGLIIAVKLVRSCIRDRRVEYQANRANCIACGRCFEFCPKDFTRAEQLQREIENQTEKQ
jgi:NosR/NirI family nitrous oxide reductase transcriptional regulator